jgi:zinc/manganese transport system substrate-binding protein
MKIYKFNITLLVLLFVFVYTPLSWAGLNVITTTSDLASIAKEVGGSLIKVNSLVKGIQDAHFIQPKPRYIVKMNRADLLIYQGLELEVGWLPVLIEGSRNPEVRLGQRGHLDISTNISRLEVVQGTVDRSMGDIHPFGNPHYNLDPENGFIIAQSIFNKLVELDPENKGEYESNLSVFKQKLKKKISQWEKKMEPFRGAKIITYHRVWSYFAKKFGLTIVNTVEVKPGVPPTTKHLAHLTALMKHEKIDLIIQAVFYEPDFANMVADKTGAKVLTLPAFVGGYPEAQDYFSLFDTIIDNLTSNLQPSS